MDRNEELKQILKEKFWKETNATWGNFFERNKVEFDFEITEPKKTHARVIYPEGRTPRAISRTIVSFPRYNDDKKVKVQAGTDLFNLDEEIINKVIKHEVVHLGHPNHDKNFRRVAREIGTDISMSQILGKGFRVQVKEGSRYKDAKTFQTMDEAVNFGTELNKKLHKNMRILE